MTGKVLSPPLFSDSVSRTGQAAWANASSERAMSTSILSGWRLNPRSTRSFRNVALFATGMKLS